MTQMGEVKSLDKPAMRVAELHPSFVNADRLRYYRRNTLRELNLVPEKLGAGVGDTFILDMFQWSR